MEDYNSETERKKSACGKVQLSHMPLWSGGVTQERWRAHVSSRCLYFKYDHWLTDQDLIVTQLNVGNTTTMEGGQLETNLVEDASLTEVRLSELPNEDVPLRRVVREQTTNVDEERPPWCTMLIENLSFIMDRINGVDTVALRLYKENILPEVNCSNIVQNLKRNGPSSAADELLEFLYRDPETSHHTTFYGILEKTGQNELAQTLRNRTAERCFNEDETQSRALPTAENLTDCMIGEELAEGKTLIHVVVGFCSESIVRKLMALDFSVIVDKLQNSFVIDLEEQKALQYSLKNSEKHITIMELNCYLQKKSKSKMLRLIDVLKDIPNTNDLALLIKEVFVKCERVSKQEPEHFLEHSPVPAKVKVKPDLHGVFAIIIKITKKLKHKVLQFFCIKADIGSIQEGCIEINFEAKYHWELENLRKSVSCGLFSQRYRSWLKEQDCDFPANTKFETTLMMLTHYGKPGEPGIEKPLAHHKESDPQFTEDATSSRNDNIPVQKEDTVCKEEKSVLALPDDLTEEAIIGEFMEGKSPVYITLAFVSQSINKTLSKADLTYLVSKIHQNKIIGTDEVQQLNTSISSSHMDSTDCIIELNCILQRKTEAHIFDFIKILEGNIHTKSLAVMICIVLHKIQDANTKYIEGINELPPQLLFLDCELFGDDIFSLTWGLPNTDSYRDPITNVVIEMGREADGWQLVQGPIQGNTFSYIGKAEEFRVAAQNTQGIGKFTNCTPAINISDQPLLLSDLREMERNKEAFKQMKNVSKIADRLVCRGAIHRNAELSEDCQLNQDDEFAVKQWLMDEIPQCSYKQLFLVKKTFEEFGQERLASLIPVRKADETKQDQQPSIPQPNPAGNHSDQQNIRRRVFQDRVLQSDLLRNRELDRESCILM